MNLLKDEAINTFWDQVNKKSDNSRPDPLVACRIIDAIRKAVGPRNYKIWKAFKETKEALKKKFGYEPGNKAVVEHMQSKGLFPRYTVKELIRVIKHVRGTVCSLDEACDKEGITLLESIDSGERNPTDEAILRVTLEECLERLTDKEKAIIYRHFYMGESIADMARDFGTSKKAVYQHKWNALKKLHDCLEGGIGFGVKS